MGDMRDSFDQLGFKYTDKRWNAFRDLISCIIAKESSHIDTYPTALRTRALSDFVEDVCSRLMINYGPSLWPDRRPDRQYLIYPNPRGDTRSPRYNSHDTGRNGNITRSKIGNALRRSVRAAIPEYNGGPDSPAKSFVDMIVTVERDELADRLQLVDEGELADKDELADEDGLADEREHVDESEVVDEDEVVGREEQLGNESEGDELVDEMTNLNW